MMCALQDETCTDSCVQTVVRFAIDPTQFVAPHNPNAPPRRQITQVTLGAEQFRAQAIMMEGGITGFHHVQDKNSTLLLIQADGAARLSYQPEDRTLTGRCVAN
ncbi:MAG: hypothetical protein ABF254_00445 [Octadecabacter sp.]